MLYGNADVFGPFAYTIEGGGGDNGASIDTFSQGGSGFTTLQSWPPSGFVPPITVSVPTTLVGFGVTADPTEFACC